MIHLFPLGPVTLIDGQESELPPDYSTWSDLTGLRAMFDVIFSTNFNFHRPDLNSQNQRICHVCKNVYFLKPFSI